MRFAILIIFIACLSEVVLADVVINEIMYNPSGDEYDFEYIELFSEEEENVSGWYFEGIDFTFPENISIDGYLVVANTLEDEGEDNDFSDRYPGVECDFEYKGTLLNSGETIILRDGEEDIIDVVSYDDWVEENHSLERVDIRGYSSSPENWAESSAGGSPGEENSVSLSNGCDWMVEIVINESASDDPEWQIKAFKINGEGKANITIQHWIEDSYGEVVKEYSDRNIENALSQSTSSKYSPALAEGEGYFIKANITSISCMDKASSNNFVSELIFVRGEEGSYSSNSSIHLQDVAPAKAEFGGVVKVKVDVYRGDTGKYAVYAYIEKDGKKISEKSTMHIKTKFINYSMTIPVQLKSNCNGKIKDGGYNVVVEGLGVSDSEEIKIEGIDDSLCKGGSSSSSEVEGDSGNHPLKKFEYEIVAKPDEIKIGEDVEIEVKLTNNDDEDYDIEIWSYVYRGNKCYSGEREKNKETKILKARNSEIVKLKNRLEEMKPGEYNLKVKIRKNSQKTTKDITETLEIIEEVEEITEDEVLREERLEPESWKEAVVYESSSFKSKKLLPQLFVGAHSLLLILLILTKTSRNI
ncbi:lamin tail domain-containing protein [Candidatus Woesearchaeota archaeon]|nr:lamin tail domain-containing protein [Candidatus Woesearchaeota archaeon]